ncbi:MAG: cytochrome c biogenesis protein CcdA [Saprospiraceae bacterium]
MHLILILFSFFQIGSAEYKPVHWTYSIEQIKENEYKLVWHLTIDKKYGTYSQYQIENSSVSPIEFIYEDSSNIAFIGKNEESGHITKMYDKIFEENVTKIKDTASFFQLIRLKNPIGLIKGYLTGIVCDDVACTPYDFDFEFRIPGQPNGSYESTDQESSLSSNTNTLGDKTFIDQAVPNLQSSYSTVKSSCTTEENKINQSSHLWTFFFGFLGGLLALLTPCVFPLIPLTVSYFTKSSKDRSTGIRNGVLYGLSIIAIYVGLGLLITSFFGATALNDLSTNPWANLIFFIIFVVFAFSFFGFYEITLPASWSTKTDAIGRNGNLLGIFFMAFTLAIVSFSCTGPIIGSALVQSATSKIGPLVVMFGFSLALALPFGLFAAFPAWLQSLPKSGSWMNSVKVVLGFLELALALKFLSVSDMTSHWGFLRYEVFMGFWVILFALMTSYLFGLFKFPHDSPVKKLSNGRKLFAGLIALWTIYLITGFLGNEKTRTYNSLSLLSGLAPPAYYNFFKPLQSVDANIKSKYPSYTKGANNLNVFKDYQEGLSFAKEVNKPMLLDFTGYGCVNCRKTEEHIWVDEKVWNRLNNDFVLVSLYCDDETPLSPTLYSKSRDKKLRNIGNKWEDFQIINFQQNSQPLYVPVDPIDQETLVPARGYHSSIKGYQQFLDCAQQAYKLKASGQLGMQ